MVSSTIRSLFSALCERRAVLMFSGIAASAVLWTLYRARRRHLKYKMTLLREARIEQQQHMANDLLDSVLQSTQGLILLFQGFADRLSKTDPMRLEMEEALDQADQLLNEA